MPTLNVVAIFTRGARGSDTAELRNARVLDDIARANEVWNSGIAPGVSCGINFVLLNNFYRPEYNIPANTVANNADPRIEALLAEIKTATNNARALYVVYVAGETLSPGSIGNAGPFITFFNSTTDYGYVGHAVMSDGAFGTYALAHEAGHVLFGRFLSNDNTNTLSVDDPSNPGDAHNNDPQNVMFPFIPASNPFINSAQCTVASQSRVLLETVTGAGAGAGAGGGTSIVSAAGFGATSNSRDWDWDWDCDCDCGRCDCCDCNCDFHDCEDCRRNCTPMVKKLNRHIAKIVENLGPDKARDLPLKAIKRIEQCRDCKNKHDNNDKHDKHRKHHKH